MKKRLIALVVIIAFFAFAACAGIQVKPTASNFKSPTIKLEEFMVPQYDGYWYFSKKVKPTKGTPGNRGAPLPMTFLFSIHNPNPYPILLEGFKFTVNFDNDFDVVTLSNQDSYWIPAGKTDHIRINTMITVRSALLNLLVTGGFKLKAKKMNVWQALERWWKGVPEYSVPVKVHEGAATFKADGVVKIVPFKAKFP